MIEVLHVENKKDKKREAGARPDQLAHLRVVALSCSGQDYDRQAGNQD